MILANLAVITTAGNTRAFMYNSPDSYVAMSADGYFDEGVNVLGDKALITATSDDGVSYHYVGSADGVVPVTTADNLVGLTALAGEFGIHGDDDINDSFGAFPSNNNKLKRVEIEASIMAKGYSLPTVNVTIFVLNLNDTDKMFLCRYDAIANMWYYQKLSDAD